MRWRVSVAITPSLMADRIARSCARSLAVPAIIRLSESAIVFRAADSAPTSPFSVRRIRRARSPRDSASAKVVISTSGAECRRAKRKQITPAPAIASSAAQASRV